MKLVIETGITGCTLECNSVNDPLEKIKNAIQGNAQSVRVEIEQPTERMMKDDGFAETLGFIAPVTPEPTSGEGIERRTVTALVEQLELLRAVAKAEHKTAGLETNAKLTCAMCNLGETILNWMKRK